MSKVTQQQNDRQEFVDNKIMAMIKDCLDALVYSKTSPSFEWDIEVIEDIRDLVFTYVKKHNLPIDENDFYPFVWEEKEERLERENNV